MGEVFAVVGRCRKALSAVDFPPVVSPDSALTTLTIHADLRMAPGTGSASAAVAEGGGGGSGSADANDTTGFSTSFTVKVNLAKETLGHLKIKIATACGVSSDRQVLFNENKVLCGDSTKLSVFAALSTTGSGLTRMRLSCAPTTGLGLPSSKLNYFAPDFNPVEEQTGRGLAEFASSLYMVVSVHVLTRAPGVGFVITHSLLR